MITLDEALQAHTHGTPNNGPIRDAEPPRRGGSWGVYDNDAVPGLCAYYLMQGDDPNSYVDDECRLVGVVSYPNGEPHWTPA